MLVRVMQRPTRVLDCGCLPAAGEGEESAASMATTQEPKILRFIRLQELQVRFLGTATA